MFVYVVSIESVFIDGFGELHRYIHTEVCSNKTVAKVHIANLIKYNLIYFRDAIYGGDINVKNIFNYCDTVSGTGIMPFEIWNNNFALNIEVNNDIYKFKLWHKSEYNSCHLKAEYCKMEVQEG